MGRINPNHAFALTLAFLACVPTVFAHPGGLDSNGGHNDKKHGGYHFHSGQLAGHSYASKSEALQALAASGASPKTTPTNAIAATGGNAQPASEDRLDALLALLQTKGVITREEATKLGLRH